jgi:hypothetical protein
VDESTVRRSESIAALAKAMCAAQAELKNPPKDSVNPHYKSKYADLATVRDTVIPVLAKHGLSLLQLPSELGTDSALTTLLAHTSGEWVETTIRLRPVKNDPQGVGSALTYARRYALQSVAGVAAEDDDDGHAGSQQRQAKPAAPVNAPGAHLPPDGPPPFVVLRNLLQNSQAEPALKSAFGAAYKAHEKGEVTDEEFGKLTALKDAMKAKLAAPAA